MVFYTLSKDDRGEKMTNLFNIDIDRIIHNGVDVTLIVLNGVIVYEKLKHSLTYTVHNDISGVIGGPISAGDVPQFWIDNNGWDYDKVLVTRLDGTIADITNTFYGISISDIAKVQISYSEDVYNIRFQSMDYLKTVEYVDISNLTSLRYMFYGCNNLESINMKDWNTSNITDMSEMFWNCESLTELDLSNFNTSNVTNMYRMFTNCNSLTTLRLDNFNTSNVTNMEHMLAVCSSLHTLRLDNCTNETIDKILNSDGFPTGFIPDVTREIYCKKEYIEQNVPPYGWNFISVNGEPNIPEPPNEKPLYIVGQFEDVKDTITTADVLVNTSHTDLSYMFDSCKLLTSVNTEGWNTSNVTTMYSMFSHCESLTTLDVSNFDTSNVTIMSAMFDSCYLLTELDVSNFDTSNVINMGGMFYNCQSLTSLDLSSWDIANVFVIDMAFDRCPKLVNFKAPKNINANMYVRNSTKLSHDSLMSIINNLVPTTSTKTLELGTTNLNKLTDAEIAIATNKGWTVS